MKEMFLSVLLVGSLVGGVCRAATGDQAQQLSREIHLKTSALLEERLEKSLRRQIELLLESETKTATTGPAGEDEDFRFSDSSGKQAPCLEPSAR